MKPLICCSFHIGREMCPDTGMKVGQEVCPASGMQMDGEKENP